MGKVVFERKCVLKEIVKMENNKCPFCRYEFNKDYLQKCPVCGEKVEKKRDPDRDPQPSFKENKFA
jgi:uncharacterized Zn finger protein (UPF0148 family)